MIAVQPPNIEERVTYSAAIDVSSNEGSVTIAVTPDTELIVRREIVVAEVVPMVPCKKPNKYAVIRGSRRSTPETDSEAESRTRQTDAGVAFGRPRIGFTALKR